MSEDKLLDLELVVLNKRVEILKELGAEAILPYGLEETFLDLMKDKWIFNGVLTSHYAFSEMSTEGRDDQLKAILPKKRGRPPKKINELEYTSDYD